MVNAQEWLDREYPEARKKVVPRLNIKEKNLEGTLKIENFTNLKEIDCSNNQITSLEIINCSNLKKFDYKDIQNNTLIELKLNGLKKLSHLNLVEGCLLEIEIKNCAKLQLFNYSRGYYARHLVKLSLENCPNLEIADCSNNSLTELTLHQTEKLTRLNCENNQLISLDLRDHFNLEEVKCSGNQLTELLLGELKELVRLECQNNQLANLEVNGCSDLGKLDCQNNKLTTLEVGNLKELNELQCSNNLLINLDLSNNKELEILNISNNKFQEQTLDFLAHLFKLENLLLEHNELVGSLKPLRCMSRLKVLNISYTNVDSGLEHLSNSLEKFYCSNKQGYKVEEIEKELKGKVIAKKDYITSHYPDSSYNSYGYSGNNDKNKNPNYADYPTYEFKHHRPSDGNFTSILQEWKKENMGKVQSAELTKQLDEKEKKLKQTQKELTIEREHAKNMDNFYRQNPPQEEIALQNILQEISTTYLETHRENKQLKEENKQFKNQLELMKRLVEMQIKEHQSQIQILPK